MADLKELYENPVFANAMKQLTEEQRKLVEADIIKLFSNLENSVLKPLAETLQKSDNGNS